MVLAITGQAIAIFIFNSEIELRKQVSDLELKVAVMDEKLEFIKLLDDNTNAMDNGGQESFYSLENKTK